MIVSVGPLDALSENWTFFESLNSFFTLVIPFIGILSW